MGKVFEYPWLKMEALAGRCHEEEKDTARKAKGLHSKSQGRDELPHRASQRGLQWRQLQQSAGLRPGYQSGSKDSRWRLGPTAEARLLPIHVTPPRFLQRGCWGASWGHWFLHWLPGNSHIMVWSSLASLLLGAA